ncbi:MAG: putative helicase [Firmicutes bacterium]|nr:putative helicase [Bacillota bacterium]
MSLPVSNSNKVSSAFALLDPKIQRWIWQLGWTELRNIQEQAIPVILHDSDVIIAAATASGKTEAAFFPILTKLLSMNSQNIALYIGPLKALINDQWERLELLCEELGIPVTPWHGDISGSKKKRFIDKPNGCVLITPESLEAMLMLRGHQVPGIFSSLRYCVVDEVHAFMGNERGKQLQSLLNRLETVIGRSVPRIGLSATIGDMKMAARFLRPANPDKVTIITSPSGGQELKVLVSGYRAEEPKNLNIGSDSVAEEDKISYAQEWVAKKLFAALRGANHLVFPNTRTSVEIYTDKLRKMCEEAGLPNEFWPHHGNLSKEIREETEQALKKKEHAATAICTNTLELGIDIGSVKSIAQVGPPPSVASLRQRIGRSGRKPGEASILRAYCIEDSLNERSRISDLLREQLVQTIAMIRLLAGGWCEPIGTRGLHLSTMVQQLLSSIGQYGGLTASNAWGLLCENGPFYNLSKTEFAGFLRGLARQDVLSQEHTGLLLLGSLGEKIVNHYTFFAAFKNDEEYRIIYQGKPLGTLPISRAITLKSYLIFAGRRWRVEDVDEQKKTIVVLPDKGGKAPSFSGVGSRLHNRVREEMREVLRTSEHVPFVDKIAFELLREARTQYHQLALGNSPFVKMGNDVLLFAWKGDDVQDTISLMLTARGLITTNEGLYISVQANSLEQVYDHLLDIYEERILSEEKLVEFVKNKQQEKWDWLLSEELLNKNYASLNIDVPGAVQAIEEILNSCLL